MTLLPAGVEGWLTEAQAARLAARARDVPADGAVVELGSFRGRSTIVLARAAPVGVIAVDPHLGSDRGPRELGEDRALGERDLAAFRANLEAAGVTGRVRHLRLRSHDALATVDGQVDLLYVDGAHRYRLALADLRSWGARVRPGGRMLVHDAFSSVGVTAALLRCVAFSNDWRYAGREGSLAEYVREPPGSLAADALRQVGQLPWFARNLAIKALIVTRLAPLARVLGHRGSHWPH